MIPIQPGDRVKVNGRVSGLVRTPEMVLTPWGQWRPGYIVDCDDGSVCPVIKELVRRTVAVPSWN